MEGHLLGLSFFCKPRKITQYNKVYISIVYMFQKPGPFYEGHMIDIRKHSEVPHSERHLPVESSSGWNMLEHVGACFAFLKNI